MEITIIGAGNSGLAMSAHLAYHGHNVKLWNRSQKTIDNLLKSKTIRVDGIFHGDITIPVITTDIRIALENSELILVTTPANSYPDIAKTLAIGMEKEIPIILNPGRTFGALNFYEHFIASNATIHPPVAETQTIIYTVRKNDDSSVSVFSIKNNVKIAALKKGETSFFMGILPLCIKKYFEPAESFLETSLGNVGLVLHSAPFMLNTGWTECTTSEYKYYYDGITPTIGRLIQHIDDERLAVASALGVHVESTMEWLKREYETCGETLYDCIRNNEAYKEIDAPKSVFHRYILEDVPYGLVPFENIATALNVPTPYMTCIIDLANALMEKDFRVPMKNIDIEKVTQYMKDEQSC